jgi:hypothetical protein
MRLLRATSSGPWVTRHVGGTLAMIFGTAALIAGFWTVFAVGREITEVADLRVVLPLSGVAIVSGVVALLRRERLPGLAIGGIALATAAPVLGWVVLVAIVAVAALAVMLLAAKFQ